MIPRYVLVTLALTLTVARVGAVEFPALTVVTEPESARVEILDHGVRYEPGVWLHPGDYTIRVSHPEYTPVTRRVQLTDSDRLVRVALTPEDQVTASETPKAHATLPRERGFATAPAAVIPPQVGRYSVVVPVPVGAQRALLDVTRDVGTFPAHVRTVGAAIEAVLQGSGYTLASGPAADPRLPTLLALPLPTVHRSFGVVRLRDALEALAGPGWQLVLDPVHRRVSFEVSSAFAYGRPDASWQ